MAANFLDTEDRLVLSPEEGKIFIKRNEHSETGKVTNLKKSIISMAEDIKKSHPEKHASNYKQFLKLIKEKEKKDLAIISFKYEVEDEKPLLIVISRGSDEDFSYLKPHSGDIYGYDLIALYEIENDSINKVIDKLIHKKNDSVYVTKTSLFLSHNYNYYNYYVPVELLEVILTVADLKERGEKLHRKFFIPKKSGGKREINAPNDELNVALKNLNGLLQAAYDRRNSEFQVAYKKGKSIVDNAILHTENQYVFNIDLKDFFPSCKGKLVRRFTGFLTDDLLYGETIQELLMEAILIDDTLYIGNPVSGTLANAIVSKPVAYMRNMGAITGVEVSVYADDITFSSSTFLTQKYVTDIFNQAFSLNEDYKDFRINEKKSHGMSKDRRRITGVTINHRNEMTVSRKFYRDIRVKVHKLSIDEPIMGTAEQLRGQIAHMLNIDKSGKLLNLVNKFEGTFLRHKLMSKENIEALRKGER